MVDHQERTVSVRDGRLSVKVLEGGSGDPMVYFHGAGGLPGWARYLDRLAQDFRVYAPYQPGVGESEGLEHIDDVWDLVLFYEELLDALGLEQVYLVGHTYGGMVAAELAAQCRQRVRRLVITGALGLWLDHAPTADIFVLSPEESAKRNWYDPESEVARSANTRIEDPQAKAEADLNRAKTMSAIGKFVWPLPDRGLRKRIHRITAPTLLLWGDSDGIVPPAYGEEYHRLIPGSRLVLIEKCGHQPQTERPEEFFSAVVGFLKES